MAMAFRMNHEEKREAEVRNLISRELNEPLMIRVELDNPSGVISTHQHLGNVLRISQNTLSNKLKPSPTLRTWRGCWEKDACMPIQGGGTHCLTA